MPRTEWRLRPFTPDDYPRLAEIKNLWEPEPVTAEELADEDSRTDPKGVLYRVMAELADGQTIGYSAAHRFSEDFEGSWWVTVALDLPWRSRGWAEQILRPQFQVAFDGGGRIARDYFREDDLGARRFGDRVGARFVEQMFDSVLDPRSVDSATLQGAEAQLESLGLRLTRLSEEGSDEAGLCRLHKLYVAVERDMPGIYNGWERPYDHFLRDVVLDPAFRPDGVLIVADGDDWIGVAIVNEKDGRAYNQTTGVLPAYRGRGIASALKAHSIRWAQDIGAETIRTYNHSANVAMLAINRKLGYMPEPGWICYELDLPKYFEGRS